MYTGIGEEKSKRINDEDAFSYAFNRCLFGTDNDKQAFRETLVEWFYSGNWIYEEE